MSKQWLSDFHHGRKGQTITHTIPRTCLECGRDASPRWMYCSDRCWDASLENQRNRRTKEKAPK